jgi:hypothetical protein
MLSSGPYWHMIIGGSNGASLLNTVEMFNWKTLEHCYLPSTLPLAVSEHSGTVVDGVPIFCGGYGPENDKQNGCYKYDTSDQTWKRVSGINLF